MGREEVGVMTTTTTTLTTSTIEERNGDEGRGGGGGGGGGRRLEWTIQVAREIRPGSSEKRLTRSSSVIQPTTIWLVQSVSRFP